MSADAIPVAGQNPNAVPSGQRLDQWINRAAFTLNTGAYRPRRWSSITGRLREPPVHNFDLGLMKNFRITERVTFQFINNWVNAFNTPQWYGSVGNPRQIQLAGRLSS